MAGPFESPPVAKGMYQAPARQRMAASDWIATFLSAFWVFGAVIFFFALGGGTLISSDQGQGLQYLIILLVIFIPVAIITMVAATARTIRSMREESERLMAAVEAMNDSFQEEIRLRKSGLQPSVAQKLEEIVSAARSTETAVTTFTSQRQKPRKATPQSIELNTNDDQSSLELGLEPDAPSDPVESDDLIRALHFPENADDQSGFAALRRTLADRKYYKLIHACQDILTLLSEDGIFMDDIRADRARPDLWRRFANGERGGMITGLGGVRDRSSLALSAGRMRQDSVFRDTTHHFLRRFDELIQDFEAEASDTEMVALTNTRSAKAFMLLGRVNGVFD